ncbi:MAG: hydrogenase maturation nickel metallochaperone HypA [Candidatus Freyarchaeota archaeon]|nr:hydrogenase maturation nickel metallochaperone HypA [Candidatus Jordarchaeia archaeon]
MVGMHEFSTAQMIINTVIKVAEENNAKQVTEINLELGEFTLLNPEYLKFGLKVVAEGTIADRANINITIKPGVIHCLECGYEGETKRENLESVPHIPQLLSLKCPMCGSNATKIIGGRECTVKNIQIIT